MNDATQASAAALRILVSERLRAAEGERIRACASPAPELLTVDDVEQRGAQFDIAFVSRDVTGLSTKHETQPETARFYAAMQGSRSLRWVHIHSAGADRPIYLDLLARGVTLTSSAGTNAEVVAQSAVTGLLMLGRRFPELIAAQQRRQWAPLIDRPPLPCDIHGQTATIVGWGGIGQAIARIMQAIGLHIQVVRSSAAPTDNGLPSHAFEDIAQVLPTTDWLILACPLSPRTHQLIHRERLALLPAGARLINVSRGDVVDEPALIDALTHSRLAGAYLDVFAHEPLAADSPLWTLPNVIATPHSAGFAAGNAARVVQMFMDNLARYATNSALVNVVR
ncbi:D-2-hydroxyacid dehydrogenase [Diaphorobacter sp. NR2-3-3-1]|nr:D-2-hydroxyacid dehydrogenase [Diaphorobacter caeni]